MLRPLFLASVVAVMIAPGASYGQAGAIAANATVGTIASELESSVNNTINRADDAVSNNSFRVRQHLEILLGQLNAIATDQRDKTFAQLNDTQQKAFLNIKNSIDQLAQLQRVTAADVQKTSLTVGTAMGNLPLGKATPRVIDYSPVYVIGKAADAPAGSQSISVSGISLGEGAPKLRIQGAACTLASKTEIALKFTCPNQSWTASDAVGAVAGDLEVYQKRGFWSRLFGREPETRKYRVSVFVVPPTMGDFRLAVTRTITTLESKQRTEQFRSDNGHCDGARDVLFPFNVTPGWSIEPASIAPQCNSTDKSSCEGLRNVSATSFGYKGVVRNSGSCAPKVFGHRAYVDARGNVRGSVSWTETRPVTSVGTEAAGQGKLHWGQAVQLPLPSDVQAISLTVNQIDGKKVIVTGSDQSQRWYAVQSDRVNNFVLISPRDVGDALDD